MAEFTGNSGNILPQIMLLASWGSGSGEEGGRAPWQIVCVNGEGGKTERASLKTTERERNL